MDDQANGLRRLVRQEELPPDNKRRTGPSTVLVTSGKGGTGTTTIAVGLGMIAAQRGKRCVLIDANPHGGDVAVLCDVAEPWTVADVFSSRTTVREAIQPGLGGIRVLPGAWAQENLDEYAAVEQERMIGQLATLNPEVDHVFIDGGCGSGRLLRRFWRAVHAVVVVTTPELNSVMDTYASIKLLASARGGPPIFTLVNRATIAAADDVFQRLARSCRRFLGIELHYGGHVPEHTRWFRRKRFPSPTGVTRGRAGRGLRHAGEALLSFLDMPRREDDAPQPAVRERLTA